MPDDKSNILDSTELALIPEFAELTVREQAVVKGLLAGMSQKQAMLQAGYAESSSHRGLAHISSRSQIQSVIAQAMYKNGITPDKLAQRLAEGINQEDVDRANLMNSRHRYLETALRIGGHEPARETEVSESYEDRILRIKGEIEGEDNT